MDRKDHKTRYQRLLEVLQIALSKSQKSIDVVEAVRKFYGEDQENNNAVFQELLRTILENANAQVSADMKQYFVENNTEQILEKLEAVMAKLDGDANSKKQAAENDKLSTENALQMAQLPDSLTAQDMIAYQQYEVMKNEKAELESKLEALEMEVEKLKSVKEEYSNAAKSKLNAIHNHVKIIESSADLGSMVA